MSTLQVSLLATSHTPQPLWSAHLRVRPAGGRVIEQPMRTDSERVEVPSGEGSIEVVFSSGQSEIQAYTVAEGKEVTVSFRRPESPQETMSSLSLSRDPGAEPPNTTRSRYRSVGNRRESAFEATAAEATLDTLTLEVTARQGPEPKILWSQSYPDTRVCSVYDGRSAGIFHSDGSALAVLQIAQPTATDAVRLCVLPSPLGGTRAHMDSETHVAIRALDGDPLPDVQIVPRNSDLAAAIGFLERGDQRALTLLRDEVVEWSLDAMAGKSRDPVSAAIGLAALLRLGAQAKVHGWSKNLWRWFPGLPDGGALHAGVLQQTPSADFDAWHNELRDAVLQSCRAGVPLLSESVRHLRAALSVLRGVEAPDPEVLAAAAQCDRLARAMTADSVFTTLTIRPTDIARAWGEY